MVKYNRIRKKIKPTGRSERPPRPRIKAGKAVRKFRPYGSIFARTAVPAVQIQEFPPKKGDYGLFAAAHRSSRPLGVSRLRVGACGDRTASAVQIQEFFTKKATTGCSLPLTGQAGRSALSRLRVVACGDRTASAVRIQVFYTNRKGDLAIPFSIGRRLRIRTADPLGVNEML